MIKLINSVSDKCLIAHLKVVVTLEEGAWLQRGCVELAWLWAGVAAHPEEEVVLHVALPDRRRRTHHVRQLQPTEVLDLLGLEKTAKEGERSEAINDVIR